MFAALSEPVASRAILGVRVDATNYPDAAARIAQWACAGESRCVCVCNVHMIMEAHDAPEFRAVVNSADLVTPDGMPLVWALRWLGVRDATRVDGSGLTLAVCAAAERERIPVALYGGTTESVGKFRAFAQQRFPNLRIAAALTPPFQPLRPEEDAAYIRQLTEAGARIVLVSLGCPKQEKWMAAHRGQLAAVMIGVGAAIDFHAGIVRRAPLWMQRIGLEWLYRLLQEPRRLWRRYLLLNPRFMGLLLLQLLRLRKFDE